MFKKSLVLTSIFAGAVALTACNKQEETTVNKPQEPQAPEVEQAVAAESSQEQATVAPVVSTASDEDNKPEDMVDEEQKY